MSVGKNVRPACFPEPASPEGVGPGVSSEDLLALFERDGDCTAFAEIVRRHLPDVLAICRRTTGNNHDAEDAAQVVLLTLATQARAGNGIGCVGAWLGRVAERTSLDLVRSRSRRRKREEKKGESAPDECAASGSPDHSVMLRELQAQLREEIGKLPPKYRLPLILHYFGGLDPTEVSRELGCARGTLVVRLHRARKMLSKQLSLRGISAAGLGAGTGLGLMVVEAVLGALSRNVTPGLNQSISGQATASAAQPLVASAASRIMSVVRACSLGATGARLKLVVALLLIVSTSLADPPAFLRRAIPNSFDVQALIDSAKRRFSEPFGGLQRMFHAPIPRLTVSQGSQDPSPAAPAASNAPASSALAASVDSRPPILPWVMRENLASTPLPGTLARSPSPIAHLIAAPERPPESFVARYGSIPAAAGRSVGAGPVTLTSGRSGASFGGAPDLGSASHHSGSKTTPADLGIVVADTMTAVLTTAPVLSPQTAATTAPLNLLQTLPGDGGSLPVGPDLTAPPSDPIPLPAGGIADPPTQGTGVVPEPTGALVLFGAAWFACLRRRRTGRTAPG